MHGLDTAQSKILIYNFRFDSLYLGFHILGVNQLWIMQCVHLGGGRGDPSQLNPCCPKVSCIPSAETF